ncbi:MAG TPA: hypothetical protein VN736_28980 [Candidatus Limnocylindrales bacterium]|nr:hypothetical protein [Candidatus Limnocylindrales bacterium]
MKSFRFSLQKVLEWRQTELELAEAGYKRETSAVLAIDEARRDLAREAESAELEVRRGAVRGCDLSALSNYRKQVKKLDGDLLTRRDEAQKRVQDAQRELMEARRRCRLLERLGERRRAEWQAECDVELEEAAAESYLARWVRGQA